MIYSGDLNDNSSIKLTISTKIYNWYVDIPLVFESNTEGTNIQKKKRFL